MDNYLNTVDQITVDLARFTGTQVRYNHPSKMLYTEGIKYLEERCAGWWLIDAIAAHQNRELCEGRRKDELQTWKLTILEDKSGILVCEWQPGIIARSQKFRYLDFPLSKILLYLKDKTLHLPSETNKIK